MLKEGDRMAKRGVNINTIRVILCFAILIVSAYAVLSARMECGIYYSSINETEKSNNVILNLNSGETSTTCTATLSECTQIGAYKGYVFTNDTTTWINGFNTNDETHKHLPFPTQYMYSTIGFGLPKRGGSDAPAIYDTNLSDITCCELRKDCTYNNNCFEVGDTRGVVPNKAACGSGGAWFGGTWFGGDDSRGNCTLIVGAGHWNIGGEVATNECCGDDLGEKNISEIGGNDAPFGYDNETLACCDKATDCNYNDNCVALDDVSSPATPLKAYCGLANIWYGGDASIGNCTAIVGSGFWGLGGEITRCCGDDSGEFRIVEANSTDAPAGYNNGVTACCNTASDCNYNDACFTSGTSSSAPIPSKAACGNSLWYGGDAASNYCTLIVGAGHWNIGGDAANNECCGDDLGENNISEIGSSDAPIGYNDGTIACCDKATDCNYNDNCVTLGDVSSPATPLKAFCGLANIWYGGDASIGNCTAIVGTGFWALGGEIAKCCGDDSGEFRIVEANSTDAPAGYNNGVTACCNAASDCNYNDACFTSGTSSSAPIPSKAACGNSLWYGGDASRGNCSIVLGIAGRWAIGGNIAATTCCGDDAGEYNLTVLGGKDAPEGYNNPAETTCCDSNTACTYLDTCYTVGSTSSPDVPNKALCGLNRRWYGGDASRGNCTAITGADRWNVGGEINATVCCGDDEGEYYINTTSTGKDACCDDPSDWVNASGLCTESANTATYFYGYVKDAGGNNIKGARIDAISKTDVSHNSYNFSNSNGRYLVFVESDTYDLVASALGFIPNTTSNRQIAIMEKKMINFTLKPLASLCEADCTYNNDNTCHADCNHKEGCFFFSDETKAACDGQQKGWVIDLLEGNEVMCCEGAPSKKQGATVVGSEVSTPNKVRQVRIVMYQGRPVQMIVDVFM